MSRHYNISDDDGSTAVEYALIILLIALVIIFAVAYLGEILAAWFNRAANSLSN